MSNRETYIVTLTIKDEKLIKRVRKAHFEREGQKSYMFSFLDTVPMVECLDYAVLLGVRNICYQQEGDTPLTKDEAMLLVSNMDKHFTENPNYVPKDEDDATNQRFELFQRFEERIGTDHYIGENEDGSINVVAYDAYFDYVFWRNISKLFPDSELEIKEYSDYNYDTETAEVTKYYLIKNGEQIKTRETHDIHYLKESEDDNDEDYDDDDDDETVLTATEFK